MQKRLFLTGPQGCGKSTLLREALGTGLVSAGGFVTVRAVSESGSFLGYDLLPAAALGGAQGYEPARFMDCTVFPIVHNNEVYRVEGVRLLQEAEYYPFALLDELGGFELIIPQFRKALEDFLNSGTPCIGAVKSLEDMELLRGILGLGERYTEHAARLHEVLKSDPETLVLDVSGPEDPAVRAAIAQWAAEYAT